MNNVKKIKICLIALKGYPIFNPQVGTYFGGAEVDLYYLATELAKDKTFELSFLVADYGQADEEIIRNVRVIKTLNFKKPIKGILKIWNGLKSANADIYFIKCASAGVPLVSTFCKLYNRIFIYRLASRLESDGTYIKQHPIIGRLFALSLKKADLVFAQNSADADNLMKNMNISSTVIPNGHLLPPMSQSKRDIILWVGRDEPVKRPELFLDLAQAIPNEHFTMICQTLNNDMNYTNLVERAGKIKNLQFIRHCPFNEINGYFQKAKIFVNTSDSEGFPNTFIQACIAATTILSLNVNPDDFLVKYNCGICCDGNFKKLTESVEIILADNNFIQMGASARKYVDQNHDIKKIIEEYKKLFVEILK